MQHMAQFGGKQTSYAVNIDNDSLIRCCAISLVSLYALPLQ